MSLELSNLTISRFSFVGMDIIRKILSINLEKVFELEERGVGSSWRERDSERERVKETYC